MKNISEKKTIDVTVVNFSPIATFKQGDAAVLKLELFKNGEVFNITGQTVKLGAYRPNKTIVEQLDGFTIDNNALTINLKNNILAVHGIVEVDLTLTDSAGEMTTASFYLKVNKKVLGSDNIAASDEIDSLKQIKLDLTTLNENAKRDENTRIENEKIRVNNEIKRQEFYENKAKPLVENLKNYDLKITNNTKNIADNTKDIERAFDTINNGSFLPFEDENLTIEHSKVGFTKDMVIEGRTYHNLNSKKYFNSCPQNQYIYHLIYNKNSKLIEDCIYTIVNVSDKTIFFENPVDTVIKLEPHEKKLFNYNYKDAVCGFKVRFFKDGWGENIEDLNIFMESFMILEGNYTNKYIPSFFTGIKSVGEKESKINILSNNKNYFNPNDFIQKSVTEFENGFKIVGKEEITVKFNLKGKWTLSYKKTSEGVKNENGGLIGVKDQNGKYKYTMSYLNDIVVENGIDEITIYNYCEGTHYITDIQLERGDKTKYEPYKKDKKELNPPFEGGLKGLPNGVKDLIYNKEDGCYVKENIRKVVLNGSEEWGKSGYNWGVYGGWVFYHNVPNLTSKTVICSSFRVTDIPETQQPPLLKGECLEVKIEQNTKEIRIFKKDVTTIEEFKAWLQANPVEVYYQLETPVKYKIADLNSINLETFKDITHVSSENEIQPNLSFKAPVDVPTLISSLKVKNNTLEKENKELKGELDTKTLRLHDQDVELTNSDLDLDFRIFELEMNIGLPINLNMKGVKNMARSPFEMMKILILNNNYDRDDIEYKASRYLQGKRITQAEYDEIISLMDANELVK